MLVDLVIAVDTNAKTKYVVIVHPNELEKTLPKQDINHAGAEWNCMCNTMNNIICNLESRELHFREWHTHRSQPLPADKRLEEGPIE